jgi:cell division septation protein DedD
MVINKIVLIVCCSVALALAGCSRQQSDWEKARAANTTDSYEQFLKSYPNGEFTAQAQARVKDLYQERDWQKARDTDTLEAYQAFLKQYPEGKWTEEARIRVENFTLAQAPSATNTNTGAADTGANAPPAAAQASPAATKPQAPPPAPAPSAAANSTGSAGAYGIQLGAFKNSDAVDKRWAGLQKQYPAILAGLSHKVLARKTPQGTVYRLQATGLTAKQSRGICHKLKAKAQACIVIPPIHH